MTGLAGAEIFQCYYFLWLWGAGNFICQPWKNWGFLQTTFWAAIPPAVVDGFAPKIILASTGTSVFAGFVVPGSVGDNNSLKFLCHCFERFKLLAFWCSPRTILRRAIIPPRISCSPPSSTFWGPPLRFSAPPLNLLSICPFLQFFLIMTIWNERHPFIFLHQLIFIILCSFQIRRGEEKKTNKISKIWVNCYCWGKSSMVEGRFSKWF